MAGCEISLRFPAKSNQNFKSVNFLINISLEEHHLIQIDYRSQKIIYRRLQYMQVV